VGFIEARQQARAARMQAARSEQVARFLEETLKAAGPSVARGRDTSLLREMLEKTAGRIEAELKDQPEVQGELWSTLGNTFGEIGDQSRAIDMYQRAAASYRAAFGEQSSKLATLLGRLGRSQSFAAQVEAGKANARRGLEMARQCGDRETLAT